ncbi:arginine--tRNA ligase [Candidatus Micrarchaeota archaeon]|nr:arginine--tRNA ligase [Candidatus Micrarchaeota archaeon]
MLDGLKEEIASMLAGASGASKEVALETLEPGKVGDLSSRLAFVLAKERKENPAKLAADIAKGLKPSSSFDKIEAAGPYVNFYLSDKAYSNILSDMLGKKGRYGAGKKKAGKVIMEFPSVNPNKPWHIGHLRNALLGDSVARILEFDGHEVERMDYIDDLGLQVAQSLWGFLNYDSNPQGKFDSWLGHQYVGVAKRFEEDKAVVEGVRETVKLMEEGDNEIARAGRDLAEKCVAAQYQTSFEFGIFHDVLIFESDILRTIFNEGVAQIKENRAVVLEAEGKNAGCWVVKLGEEFEKEFGKMENPDKVLIRSDGTAVYTGKDVIFHLWKFGKLKNRFGYAPFIGQPNGKTAFMTVPGGKDMPFGAADSAINVIGVEQKYPQRVIVEVLRRLKYEDEAANLHHLSYEHVGLPDEKFSGRKGTWVGYTADELLAEAKSRVMEKIKVDAGADEKAEIAKIVGAGAIKYSFLRTSSDKRITFRWEDALNMEGDSGPYLQYAYVRTRGILGKAQDTPSVESVAFGKEERALIKRLAMLRDIVARSAKERAPHHITQYALDVAADFSSFYTNCPVLVAEDSKVRRTRLAITEATGIALKSALGLLGIDCPKRM